jgi:hypothetical protein
VLAAFIAVTTALWVRVKKSVIGSQIKKWPAQASKLENLIQNLKRNLKAFFST